MSKTCQILQPCCKKRVKELAISIAYSLKLQKEIKRLEELLNKESPDKNKKS
jgi:hypothetical protein